MLETIWVAYTSIPNQNEWSKIDQVLEWWYRLTLWVKIFRKHIRWWSAYCNEVIALILIHFWSFRLILVHFRFIFSRFSVHFSPFSVHFSPFSIHFLLYWSIFDPYSFQNPPLKTIFSPFFVHFQSIFSPFLVQIQSILANFQSMRHNLDFTPFFKKVILIAILQFLNVLSLLGKKNPLCK